eukprot:Gb_06878 [translate_table: standard]
MIVVIVMLMLMSVLVTMIIFVSVLMNMVIFVSVLMTMAVTVTVTVAMAMAKQEDHDKINKKAECCNNKHKLSVNCTCLVKNPVNSLVHNDSSDKPNNLYGH